jgi:hypothetical protein
MPLFHKIFYTRTTHSTHYESQEPPLCVVLVFDANGNQSLLTLSGKVQKSIFFFLQML